MEKLGVMVEVLLLGFVRTRYLLFLQFANKNEGKIPSVMVEFLLLRFIQSHHLLSYLQIRLKGK